MIWLIPAVAHAACKVTLPFGEEGPPSGVSPMSYVDPFGNDTGIPYAPILEYEGDLINLYYNGTKYSVAQSYLGTVIISLLVLFSPFVIIPIGIGLVTAIEESIRKLGVRGELFMRHADILRENSRIWLETSLLGRAEDTFQILITFVVFLLYVIELYIDKLPVWLAVVDLLFFLSIAADYIVRLYVAAHRTRFFLSFMSFVDITAFMPTVAYFILINLPHASEILRPLVLMRGIRILRVNRLQRFIQAEIPKQAITLLNTGISIILILASTFHFLENNLPDGRTLSFHDCVYFAIVSISTVGYGDISPTTPASRALVSVSILVAIILVPLQTQKLFTLYYERNPFLGEFSEGLSKRHVVIVANFTSWKFLNFCREFFHESYNAAGLKVVILAPREPNKKIKSLLEHPSIRFKIQMLEGSALKDEDLERAAVRKSDAVIILTDSIHRSSETEDNNAIMSYLSIKDFHPDCDVRLQVVSKRAVRLALSAQFPESHLMCSNEITMSLLAMSTQCPGFVNFMANVSRSFSRMVALKTSMEWVNEYIASVHFEVYSLVCPDCFFGMSFTRAQVILYELFGILLLGCTTWVNDKEFILLNGGGRVPITEVTRGFVIASSETQVLRVKIMTSIPKDLLSDTAKYDSLLQTAFRPRYWNESDLKSAPDRHASHMSKKPLEEGGIPLQDIEDPVTPIPSSAIPVPCVAGSDSVTEGQTMEEEVAKGKWDDSNFESPTAAKKNRIQEEMQEEEEEEEGPDPDNKSINISISAPSHAWVGSAPQDSDRIPSLHELVATSQPVLEQLMGTSQLDVTVPMQHLDVDEIAEAMARMRAANLVACRQTAPASYISRTSSTTTHPREFPTHLESLEDGTCTTPLSALREESSDPTQSELGIAEGSLGTMLQPRIEPEPLKTIESAEEIADLGGFVSDGKSPTPWLNEARDRAAVDGQEIQHERLMTVQYVSLSNFLLYDVGEMKRHHIVLGYHPSLVHFIATLRATYLQSKTRPIVIVVQHLPPDEAWSPVSIFEDVFIVQGTSSITNDAQRLNLKHCESVTILAEPHLMGDELMVDSHAVFTMQVLDTLLPDRTPRVVEIIRSSSLRLIPKRIETAEFQQLESDYQALNVAAGFIYDPHLLRSHFTAGHVMPSSMLDSICYQAFFKADLMGILSSLVLNVDSLSVYQLRGAGFWESHPRQERIPTSWIGRSIGSVFIAMFECFCTPLYIYREVSIGDNVVQYVVTNPAKGLSLRESDEICYLCCEISTPLS